MRFLHPIAAHEKFVARGTYRLFSQDREGASELYAHEHWTIHEVGQGGQFIRIDHAPLLGGVNELVEIFRSPKGEIERFDVRRWLTQRGAPKREASISVMREGQRALLMRRIDHGEHESLELELDDDTILLPRSILLLADFTLHGMRRAKAFFLSAGVHLFSPLVEALAAQYEADETLLIGKRDYEARRYWVRNDATSDEFYVWLDDHNIPLQAVRLPQVPIAELFNYAHR